MAVGSVACGMAQSAMPANCLYAAHWRIISYVGIQKRPATRRDIRRKLCAAGIHGYCSMGKSFYTVGIY